MALANAAAVITRARDILGDVDGIRWPNAELLRFVSDGQRRIVQIKPEAGAALATVQLTLGTKQSIPANALRLQHVLRNMGDNGTSPGASVFRTSRAALEAEAPNWSTRPTGRAVEHYIYEPEMDPRRFWVYPSLSQQTYVEISCVYDQAEITDANAALTIDAAFHEPLVDYTIVRATSKDLEHAGNMQRANFHAALFLAALGAPAMEQRE